MNEPHLQNNQRHDALQRGEVHLSGVENAPAFTDSTPLP